MIQSNLQWLCLVVVLAGPVMLHAQVVDPLTRSRRTPVPARTDSYRADAHTPSAATAKPLSAAESSNRTMKTDGSFDCLMAFVSSPLPLHPAAGNKTPATNKIISQRDTLKTRLPVAALAAQAWQRVFTVWPSRFGQSYESCAAMLTGFKARRPGLSKGRAQSRHCPRAECRVWWLQRRADALM